MKRSIYRIFIFYGALVLTGITANAQNISLVKTLQKSFDVNSNVSLELNNKYGDVVINGWDKNVFEVKIKLTTYGKTDSDTEKLMDRVEFDFNVAKDFVIIETIMDRDKGVLNDFFKSLGDYSKSLLSKNELDIDFEIWLPKGSSIDLTNKFGDVIITEVRGKITVEQSHGNFKADHITNLARINVSYGNIRINSFKTGSISIKGGELEIQEAEKANIASKQSKLYLKKMGDLQLESTSDRIRISEINSLSGKSSFSNLDIFRLNGSCSLDQSYGELILHAIKPGFTNIALTGKSTDYNISLPTKSQIGIDITAKEDRLLMLEEPKGISKAYADEKEKTIHITGYYGNDPAPSSRLKVFSTGGEVSINFAVE